MLKIEADWVVVKGLENSLEAGAVVVSISSQSGEGIRIHFGDFSGLFILLVVQPQWDLKGRSLTVHQGHVGPCNQSRSRQSVDIPSNA